MVLLTALVLSLSAGCAGAAILSLLPQADVGATRAVRRELGRSATFRRLVRDRVTPGVATGLGLTVALLGVVVTGVLFGVLVYLIRRNAGVLAWDVWVAHWAADHASLFSTRVLEFVTNLGSTAAIVVIAVSAAVHGVLRWRRVSVVLYLALVAVGQLVIVTLIKTAVDRVRPAIDPLAGFSGASFPSGHSTAAAATFAAIALVVGRGRAPKARAVLGGLAIAIAVAVGCSRMFLGVHWFSDVLAGWALGWAWFGICTVAFGGRFLRFGAPAEVITRAPRAGQAHPGRETTPG